ncbi:MAG: hypothetical protein JWM91_3541 [Rhodospirillales bacterium]|nr:hypothetical protein [Rhodospirillales bacterium]
MLNVIRLMNETATTADFQPVQFGVIMDMRTGLRRTLSQSDVSSNVGAWRPAASNPSIAARLFSAHALENT